MTRFIYLTLLSLALFVSPVSIVDKFCLATITFLDELLSMLLFRKLLV